MNDEDKKTISSLLQERDKTWEEMLNILARLYGHGSLENIDETIREQLNDELEEFSEEWDLAEHHNLEGLLAESQFQQLLSKHYELGEKIMSITDSYL